MTIILHLHLRQSELNNILPPPPWARSKRITPSQDRDLECLHRELDGSVQKNTSFGTAE